MDRNINGLVYDNADRLQEVVSILLEPVCKIRKEENRSESNHGREISSAFFIASGDPTELFEAIDQTFDNVALTIKLPVERAWVVFVPAMRNGAANISLMEILPKHSASVAFVRDQALRAQTPVAGCPTNRACFHQVFCQSDVAFLTGSEQKSDQSAGPFTTNVDFGGESTSTTA